MLGSLLLLLLVWVASAYALYPDPAVPCTHYVDPTNGSNSNTGLTAGSPWKTFDKIVDAPSGVGGGLDTVVWAKRRTHLVTASWNGGAWRNLREGINKGTAGHPITIQPVPGDVVTFDGAGGGNYFFDFFPNAGSVDYYYVIRDFNFVGTASSRANGIV